MNKPLLFVASICLSLGLSSNTYAQLPTIPEDYNGPTVTAWGYKIPLNTYLKQVIGVSDNYEKFHPTAWGDQGNGTYINPILNADFSDPDAIRVGDKYYMVASDFHFMGMQVLESDDLVNWKYVSQIYSRIPQAGYDTNEHYSHGSWAPSIRYHDGRFYVYFCTPTEGLYMSSAPSAEGPWTDLLLVHEGTGPGWEDPCPFWDEDGQAYLGRSQCGAGPIIIHKMSQDGTKLLDEGVTVYEGPVAEGTKIHKWNGYYYLSIPEGGVGGGNQVCLRSASIYGPYDKKVVLETGSTVINGPHQGAIIDTPDGEWYFMHFQLQPVLGRVVHLQPMHWEDGWPIIGVDIDRNGIGEPVLCWEMPKNNTGTAQAPQKPTTSDDFNSPELSLQWQWNHNPVNDKWSLSDKPGKLALYATKADNFLKAKNTLTQKLLGYSGEATVTLETGSMAEGQKAGLSVMGAMNQNIGVKVENGKKYLYTTDSNAIESQCIPISGSSIKFKVVYDTYKMEFQFSYSISNKPFVKYGDPFMCLYGNWKGVRLAIYNYNSSQDKGIAYFDDFVYNPR